MDVVLLSGDLADMPLELCYTAPPDEVRAQHMLLDKVLEEFVPLASKVYYIPGNVSIVCVCVCYRSISQFTYLLLSTITRIHTEG